MITITPLAMPNPVKGLAWALRSNVLNALKYGMKYTADISREKFLSGGGKAKRILNYRSGRLSRSVIGMAVKGPVGYIGTGTLSSDTEYSAIHEYGGIISHPGTDKFVKFYSKVYKKYVYSRGIAAHAIPIPARPYLSSAVRDAEPHILGLIDRAMNQSVKDVR